MNGRKDNCTGTPRTDEATNLIRKAVVWHGSLINKIAANNQFRMDTEKLAEAVELYKKRSAE